MDDTTRQKVEESPEERKRRIRRQRMIQERRRRRRRKALILRGNPCVDLCTDTCGDRLRRFLRSKKVQAVSSREKRFKKTGNPGDKRNCADGSGGS